MKPKSVKIISITVGVADEAIMYGLGDNEKIYRYVVTTKGGYWELVTL